MQVLDMIMSVAARETMAKRSPFDSAPVLIGLLESKTQKLTERVVEREQQRRRERTSMSVRKHTIGA